MASLEAVKQLGVTHELSNCKLTRVEIDDNHYYYIQNDEFPDGQFCASVTSVIDEAGPVQFGLREFWKNNSKDESEEIFRKAGERGTKLHHALEELLGEMELDLEKHYPSVYEKDAIVTFIRFFKFLQPLRFKSELVVASPSRKVAGTLDFVGLVDQTRLVMLSDPNTYLTIDDSDNFVPKIKYASWLEGEQEQVKVILDWKFSSAIRYAHEKQIPAYLEFYNESYAKERPVTQSGIWHYNPRCKYKFDLRILKGDVSGFDRLYATYLDMHDGILPEPKDIVVYPKKVKLLESK